MSSVFSVVHVPIFSRSDSSLIPDPRIAEGLTVLFTWGRRPFISVDILTEENPR